MLAIGRGLMSEPRLLLLDEPSLGLAPMLVREVLSIIEELHHTGMTVLLVEQNARAALKISDKGYVLETGRIALSGDSRDLLNNEKVKEAYLGL
jgi:branched-chain amino acid transport system ATP-binding protein